MGGFRLDYAADYTDWVQASLPRVSVPLAGPCVTDTCRDQYEIEILPRARLGRLLSKSPRTYKGSIQLWQPNNLSAHHASNIRDVQEIGSHGARVQGVSRIEPRPSMLIFMEAAESQAQELTVFRIVRRLSGP